MLPDKIELEVVTPERLVLHEYVKWIQMPARDGYDCRIVVDGFEL